MSEETGPRAVIAAVFDNVSLNTPFYSGVIYSKLGRDCSPENSLLQMSCISSINPEEDPEIGQRNLHRWEFFHDPLSPDHLRELRDSVDRYNSRKFGKILAAPGECNGCHYAKPQKLQAETVICPRLEKFAILRKEMLGQEGLQIS